MSEVEASPPSPYFYGEETLESSSKPMVELFGIHSKGSSPADFLHSLLDEPDFHDPFSELNLFLAQEIKEYMRESGCLQKWCSSVEKALIEQISPRFQKRFPHLRLSVSALKKTWEKISCFLAHIQNEKEAISQNGKLNIAFFIQKNLSNIPSCTTSFHPSVYAHQLAVKMSEYMAAIDGVKPKLDNLTKLIWSLQKHLSLDSNLFKAKNPYDECDKVDKLIVKFMLDITSQDGEISQYELEHRVKESLVSLQELPSFASSSSMRANIASLLAEKLYTSLSFQLAFSSTEKKAILQFLHRQLALYKRGSIPVEHTDLVRRILALYALASRLPKELTQAELSSAVRAIYPTAQKKKPPLTQAVFAFISAELVLAKTDEYCHSVEFACETIARAYEEAKNLPILEYNQLQYLEIILWKLISSNEELLEKLPYTIGHRIEEEIAHILIDYPEASFHFLVEKTIDFFQKVKSLTQLKSQEEIERKVHTWTAQSDMIYRTLRLDTNKPLLRLIEEKSRELQGQKLIAEVTRIYLARHQELLPYVSQLSLRVTMLYKYSWYKMTGSEESSFDRFLKWQIHELMLQTPKISPEDLLDLLQDRCKKRVPLMPFDRKKCLDFFPIVYSFFRI